MYHVVAFRAYSSNTQSECFILTRKREQFTFDLCEKKKARCIHQTYINRGWSILCTRPILHFSSKWVFTLGLLVAMRLNILVFFLFFLCDCQAYCLQWDAIFDLFTASSLCFCWIYKELIWINILKKKKRTKNDET